MSVYQHGRKGTCTYTIPGLTAGGSYTVRIDFCEYAATAAGQRTFNVSINGTQVLTNYDIFASAGGEFIANAQTFTATANSSGQIVIVFTTVVNNALVAGIEVTPVAASCSANPSAPTGLAASGTTSTSTNLSWSAVTPPANCSVSSYTVFKNGTSIGASTSTSFAVTGLTASTTYSFTVAATDAHGTGSQSTAINVTTSASGGGGTTGAASINCGGSASSPFVADTDFSGGTVGSTTTAVSTQFLSAPIPAQAVLQTWRTGVVTYTMGGFTAGSAHVVSLYFMDPTATASGQRNFNVSINGSQVLSLFDIFAVTGGQFKAIQENLNATASSTGQIVIALSNGSVGSPIIAAISSN